VAVKTRSSPLVHLFVRVVLFITDPPFLWTLCWDRG